MALRLNGATSGFVELNAPAAAGSNTLTLPDGNGTSGQYLQTDGSGGLSWQTVATSNITYSTAQSTTSGTSPIEFTDVPTGVKKITIIFDDVGTATASDIVNVQLSTSASYVTTGYVSTSTRTQNASTSVSQSMTTGFIVGQLDNTSKALTGHAVLHNVSGNRWILSGVCSSTEPGDQNRSWNFGGFLDLGGTIDQLRVAGDDGPTYTWDTGQINVMYEV
jgi:hypothetical protein